MTHQSVSLPESPPIIACQYAPIRIQTLPQGDPSRSQPVRMERQSWPSQRKARWPVRLGPPRAPKEKLIPRWSQRPPKFVNFAICILQSPFQPPREPNPEGWTNTVQLLNARLPTKNVTSLSPQKSQNRNVLSAPLRLRGDNR